MAENQPQQQQLQRTPSPSSPQQENPNTHTTRTFDGPDPREMLPPRGEGYRAAAIRESRITDRPYKPASDSLRIKIELDLEVEVDLYARVKGDVTIGLL